MKITGLFCRISSLLYGSFAKETYNLNEPTNRSHPIGCRCFVSHFPQTSPELSGPFEERDLQPKASYASSPPSYPFRCTALKARKICIYIYIYIECIDIQVIDADVQV